MDEASKEKDFIAAPAPNEQGLGASPQNRADGPPRARVSDAPIDDETPSEKLERKRDYLDGFLQKKPETVDAGQPGSALYESVIEALKDIYDPEIPVNIYDLGLIYGVEVSEEADVAVTMTLTTPHCPVCVMLKWW